MNAESKLISFPSLTMPGEKNSQSMWKMMEELFPIYRSLLGPGYKKSLDVIQKYLPLDVTEMPSGEEVFDWTIPKEFKVNEAWVEGPDGTRILDFNEHPYCIWIYSQSFDGEMNLEDLKEKIATDPDLPHAYPMRQTYYRESWGLAAPYNLVEKLKPGRYKVHIDTELYNGVLRIGEAYLPGEVEDEILINSYLCHPLGANDNLSGVIAAVETFRMLAEMPNLHYSYRLALWPEGIGAIAYMARYPERLKKTIGGYQLGICGDGKPVSLDETFSGNTIFDRAAKHAMAFCGCDVIARKFNIYGGADVLHLNSVGYRLAVTNITRGGSRPGGYAEYHSSADDLQLVRPEFLLESLQVTWAALMTVERARSYKGTYQVTPFLSKYGVFPYQHGWGTGGQGTEIGNAYYAMMGEADGLKDLLQIAEDNGMSIFAFDECVREFCRVGLLMEVKEIDKSL